MGTHYFLYTVTGGREVFYAAVDRETDRVWTSPTRDGAERQARDAGLDNCTERTISKDALLESLGVAEDHPLRIDAPQVDRKIERPRPAPKAPASWFVAGEGHGAVEQNVSIPRLPKSGKKYHRPRRGKSPFTGGGPIAPPGDDVFIVPPHEHPPGEITPFTDQSPDESQ